MLKNVMYFFYIVINSITFDIVTSCTSRVVHNVNELATAKLMRNSIVDTADTSCNIVHLNIIALANNIHIYRIEVNDGQMRKRRERKEIISLSKR